MFDPDAFVDQIQARKNLKDIIGLSQQLKYPNFKVPSNNISKLGEKKIVGIVLDIKLQNPDKGNDFIILRDRFDWDLSDSYMRPKVFAKQLVDELQIYDENQKVDVVHKIERTIMEQISIHIEKNTGITKSLQDKLSSGAVGGQIRLNRKEEEMVTQQMICINCQSFLTNPDYCIHCCFQYDRKPGAITGFVSTNGIMGAIADKHDKPGPVAAKNDNQAIKENIEKDLQTYGNQNPVLHKYSPDKLISYGIIQPSEDDEVPQEEIEPWKKRSNLISKFYQKTTKEKKICKKCNHQNSFLKNECEECEYKFAKTRAERTQVGSQTHHSMNTDNYSVYFWETLQQNNDLFGQNLAQQISEYLDEKDFLSVRDLYKKIKEILSQENTERLFNLVDTNQLLELHDYLDEKFELLLTDNKQTDQIFREAAKKRAMNLGIQEVENRQGSRHGTDQSDKHNHLAINMKKCISQINKERSSDSPQPSYSNLPLGKRIIKQLEKDHKLMLRSSYRPNNFECQATEQTLENFNMLHQISYLSPQVIESEGVQRFMLEQIQKQSVKKENLDVSQFGGFMQKKGRGRPKRVEVPFDEIQDPDQIGEDLLIFPPNHGLTVDQLRQAEAQEQAGSNIFSNPQNPASPDQEEPEKKANKGFSDGNADECGICKDHGRLICCDDCPAAFHAECLGYQSQKQCPRGKWKCYFCKVSKHGISFSQRMSPNEKAICLDLAKPTDTWQQKAEELMDVLGNYYCMQIFFEKENVDAISEFIYKKKLLAKEFWGENLINLTEFKDKIQEMKSDSEFTHRLMEYLEAFSKIDKRHMGMCIQAQVCSNLLQQIIVNDEIFQYVGKKQESALEKPVSEENSEVPKTRSSARNRNKNVTYQD